MYELQNSLEKNTKPSISLRAGTHISKKAAAAALYITHSSESYFIMIIFLTELYWPALIL